MSGPPVKHLDFLSGGGETAALIRRFNWAATALGPIEGWPQSLKTATAILLNSQVPIVMLWGEDGIMIYNDAYSVFAGGRHPQLLGSKVREGWPEVADFNDNVMKVGLAGGRLGYRDQELVLYRHGRPEQVWMNLDYSPVPDESGRPAGVFAVVIETTERVLAERAKRENEARFLAMEERYRLVAQATNDAIWDWDLERNHVQWNDAVNTLFGYPLEEVEPSGEWWITHIHPDDRPRIDASIHAVIEATGNHWSEEYRFIRSDGSHVHVLDRGFVLRDEAGRAIRMIGAMLDLTQRYRAEEALRELNETLEARVAERTVERDRVWRLSRDLLGVADFEGRWVSVNPAWTRLLGWSEQEILGQTSRWFEHPDDREATRARIAQLAAGGPVVAFENRLQHRDGSYRWLSWTAIPEAGFIYCSARDVTAEKAQEDALSKAEDALRQSQKMEAVGQLTGGIAHDFNNLLTVITGNVDMARRSLAASETARAARAMDNALKGAERAASLTQRLLAFSRRQPLAPKPINVDRLVNGMADLLHRALGETVHLETVSTPGLWLVEADPNQLESAMLNLAVNARDAMPQGGKLTIETANARLDQAYSAAHAEVAPGNYVVIAVSDNGHGMGRETLARVFDPFFTTKEVGKGTGLGLSMVYGFVKQSGGHVKIYSEEHQGTTVKIYLPRLMSAEELDEPAAEPAPDGAPRDNCILVVEDDDDVRAYTVEILRELGYRVLEAHDGPSALRLLERQEAPIDLLFTDVVMPGMSGRELADKARSHQPDLKVLYTSGYTRNAIVHGGRLDSGVEMIAKPFTYQGLAQKITDVLDAGRTGRLLVVEDDATVRMFAVEALASAGYAVDEAASGSEALNMVRAAQGRYDAVVLDVGLPEKRGDALAVELRAGYARLPILLVSDEHEAELRRRFAGDSCVGVIGKPYNAAKLQAALDGLGVRCGAAQS
jgi:PAS domain S-box-containing protein